MSLLLSLSLVLAQCPPPHTALLPLEPVGVSLEEATRAHGDVARAAAGALGPCLLDAPTEVNAAEVACADDLCVATALGVRWLVRGQLVRAGGALRSSVSLFDRSTGVTTLAPSGDEAATEGALAALTNALLLEGPGREARAFRPPAWVRWVALGFLGAAAASAGAALGTGLRTRGLEAQLSSGDGGCSSVGAAYRGCLEQQLGSGATLARASTALAITGGVTGALGAAGLVWAW